VVQYRRVGAVSSFTGVDKRHHNADEQRRRAQVWTDDPFMAYLRELQARHGGILLRAHLDEDRPTKRGVRPSRTVVLTRFGGWR
jgi:hypothetical protein